MDVLLLIVVTGLVAIAIAVAWFSHRRRRAKVAELQENERIDLFSKDQH